MKGIVFTLIGILMVTIAFADINKQLTQVSAINILKSSKSSATSISESLTKLRQSIEDKLANELANLDASDQTKLNALVGEIQDIIDAADDLITKITTHYPEVN